MGLGVEGSGTNASRPLEQSHGSQQRHEILRVMPPVFSKRAQRRESHAAAFCQLVAEIAAPWGSIRQRCNRFANAAANFAIGELRRYGHS